MEQLNLSFKSIYEKHRNFYFHFFPMPLFEMFQPCIPPRSQHSSSSDRGNSYRIYVPNSSWHPLTQPLFARFQDILSLFTLPQHQQFGS
ncbi:hypothetical protein Y032_0080g1363 [Ancylostoma ceylanicum]|uniref:Uncharacterized protein n=1 Tax=Ancylostoma ceylanicum TaxID=53326 RepID=A0A016TRX5_9BILA|nr:hypothetical protein Y032_0080g1363 [Ancylostoma ceylanicum]